MAHHLGNMFWVWVAFSSICSSCFLTFLPRVQAGNWTYSSNPNDYDLGWLATGILNAGSEPDCSYCLNAVEYDITYNYTTPADLENGYFWNRTVSTFRCDGVYPNEFWAYHDPTQTIVFGNVTKGKLDVELYCIDAVDYKSIGLLKLRACDSSSVSQKWKKNGSRLVSGVRGSNGEELFMVGSIPNPATTPTNQMYLFKLTLNTYLPSPSGGYAYTSDFTFLSRKNLVDTSPLRFTTQGLLELRKNAQKGTIVNGGFENSSIQAGSNIAWDDWLQPHPSYFALCGWVINFGPIAYVKSGLLQPAEGLYSILLNAHTNAAHWGQVFQTIETEVETEYLLSFSFNGSPPSLYIQAYPEWNCSSTYTEAKLEVSINNSTSTGENSGANLSSDLYGIQQNFSIDVTNSNAQNFGFLWQLHKMTFRAATNVTTIFFTSLNVNSSCGPMIDNVSLERLQPKHFWQKTAFRVIVGCAAGLVLLVGVFLGAYFGRKWYCGPGEDYSGLYKTENARVFSVKELSASTKKFSAVLGEGAFGTVYKANFPDGTTGAVKVEKPKMHFRSSKVIASDEIAVLLRVHHRNLVNLIGFCIYRGRHMLVFEYLPNGSLHDRLHQSVIPVPPGDIFDSVEMRQFKEKVLPWPKRTKIACDVAYGLEYLHHDADPPIVHRDVKSRNILLTATDSAKLADFGLSKAAPADATTFESVETMVRGSIGYLDPQYFLTGVFSAKSDVYSYGVVLLELICGHQAIYNAAPLSTWAAPYLTSPTHYHELVDKKLGEEYQPDELESLVELSKMCMQEDSRTRPNMRQVVAFLNARRLVVAGGESAETIESDTMSREAYHKKHPKFTDFEAVSTSASSSDAIFVSPRARD